MGYKINDSKNFLEIRNEFLRYIIKKIWSILWSGIQKQKKEISKEKKMI